MKLYSVLLTFLYCFFSDAPRRTPIPDQNVDVPFITEVNTANTCFLNNGTINSEIETLTSSANEINDIEVTNDLAAFVSTTDTQVQSSLFDRLVSNKYDIVLLSLLLQMLYGISILSFQTTYFFLPLFLYTITKASFFSTQNNSNVANALLLLNGISGTKIKIILHVTQLIMLLSRDICVFLFTTICIQSLYIVIKGNIEL